MKKSELIKLLKDAGCLLERNGKKHDIWKNPRTGKITSVPRHAKEIPTGTANSILKSLAG